MLSFPEKKDQYKILVLGDIQVHSKIRDVEEQALKGVVKRAQPDLVVFLGDVLSGAGGHTPSSVRKMIHAALDVTVGTKIPFAVVSGNHESFTLIPFARQIDFYREYSNCLTPSRRNRDCREAYYLDLSKSDKPFCRLFFLDCAGSKASRIGQVYKKTKSETLAYSRKVLFDENCPPTMVFQHVIVPDASRLLKKHDKGSTQGVKGSGPFRGYNVSLLHPEAGHLGECISPAWDNKTQFPDWAKSKKVVAAVFAHDHVNSFEDELDGIKIIQCPGAGFKCYGDDVIRGARLITISRSGKIASEQISFKDL